MELNQVLTDPNSFYKVSSFCHKKGITIYAYAVRANVLKITINNNGKKTDSNENYTNETVNDKIKELYWQIYNKLK